MGVLAQSEFLNGRERCLLPQCLDVLSCEPWCRLLWIGQAHLASAGLVGGKRLEDFDSFDLFRPGAHLLVVAGEDLL